jgi:hypothetical protein
MASEQTLSPDQIHVREVTHYQFSWTAGRGFTVQLILDQGAEEHILHPNAEETDVIQELFQSEHRVYFDMTRDVLMFGVSKAS